MRKPAYKKNILFIISSIIILAVVFILVYKKGNSHAGKSPAEIQKVPETQPIEVKAASKSTTSDHMALTSDNIIWFTNYYRAEHHLKPLTLSRQLRDSAYFKSLDMFKYQYFEHYRPGNKLGFDNFIDNQKYAFIKIGENLAKGDFTTSKEIVDAWMRSPNHRANILDATYTEIGVSVDYGTMNGERAVLITQHFGKPKTTCPVVSEDLYVTIKNLSKQLISLKQRIDTGDQVDDLITEYNLILKDREVLVDRYNTQVNAFDACVARG